MEWIQVYDPLNSEWLSTLVAALPIVGLLVTLAFFEWKAQWAALTGLTLALFVAIVVYGMPAQSAAATAASFVDSTADSHAMALNFRG